MSKILPFYEEILAALRYVVNKEGYISYQTPLAKSQPAMVDGKRLVLPTKEFMRDGFGEEFQPFHPLSESISRRGTSPVQQHMQRTAKANIATAICLIADKMMSVAADPSLHKGLPPRAADYLKKLSNVNDKTYELFTQLVRAATKQNQLLTVYLKNGGTYEGKKVNRLTVIRFPIMEQLDGDSDTVCGVNIPKKHRPTISALFHLILPYGESGEQYSAGSNNRTAPYLHSFLKAYHKIAEQLNRVINKYGKALEFDVQPFPLYEESVLDNFADMYDELPPLNGNQGETTEVEEAEETNKAGNTRTVKHEEPARKVASSTATSEEKLSLADFLNAARPQQQQTQYTAVVQPQYGQYGQVVHNSGNANTQALSALNATLGVQPANQPAANPFLDAIGGRAQAPTYSAMGATSSLL